MAFQFGPEAVVAMADALPLRPADSDGQRCILHLVELVAVGAVGDHHAAAGGLHPVLDGLGPEGGEQRLVHRAEAPGAEDGDQQLRGARQQAGNPVAGTHAEAVQEAGETAGEFFQLGEGVAGALATFAFPEQRDASGDGVAVTAFDSGIQGGEVAREGGTGGSLVVELGHGGNVLAHRVTPAVCSCLE
ncbi:hypothetical protein D3C76_1107240 [compost metagenome]